MRKTKLSFNLFAQQHGNDGLFARSYRQPGSAILLQKQVSKASIAKIVGVSLPPFIALSRQGGYAHTLKGYFYTNLGGTLSPGSTCLPRWVWERDDVLAQAARLVPSGRLAQAAPSAPR